MLRKLAVYTVICLLLISCKNTDSIYNKNGVSFTVPAGWKTGTSTDSYIELDKRENFISKGSLIISWINDSTDVLNSVLESKSYLNDPLIRKAVKPVFTSVQIGKFGKYDSYSIGYKIKAGFIILTGSIYGFYAHNKTFTIIMQQLAANQAENAVAFKKIANSFNVAE